MDLNIDLDLDMELIYGNENYEELQQYFERRKNDYPSDSESMFKRLRNEYVPDILEELYEEDKISNRRQAIRRIWGLLQKVPPNKSQSSISEAGFKR